MTSWKKIAAVAAIIGATAVVLGAIAAFSATGFDCLHDTGDPVGAAHHVKGHSISKTSPGCRPASDANFRNAVSSESAPEPRIGL